MFTTRQEKDILTFKDHHRRKLKQQFKEEFDNEELDRWHKFRKDLHVLEEACALDAIDADKEIQAETNAIKREKMEKALKKKIRRQVTGALRSFFEAGRCWGWLPDFTCRGMWDRRPIFDEHIRGMRRLHFRDLRRQIINVIAMSECRREIWKVYQSQRRLVVKAQLKERKAAVQAQKEEIVKANK